MRKKIIPRFSAPQRIVHWAVGISFCGLLLSGLALSYASLFWLTALFGGPSATRVIHPWLGVVYVVAIVAMFFVWVRDMILDASDRRWLKAVPHYARHRTEQIPDAGKYNGGQKIYFWISLGLAVVFLASGIPLWFPEAFGAGLLRFSRVVHFLATVAGGLLLMVHVYLSTVAFPGTARGMAYGGVDRKWARLHHAAWLREQEKG